LVQASVATDAAYSILRNLQVSQYVITAKLESHTAKLASFRTTEYAVCVCVIVEGPWFRQLGHSPHLLASVATDTAYSTLRNLQVSQYVITAKLESHTAKLASFALWNMLCVRASPCCCVWCVVWVDREDRGTTATHHTHTLPTHHTHHPPQHSRWLRKAPVRTRAQRMGTNGVAARSV
jgi:hypothetical protein